MNINKNYSNEWYTPPWIFEKLGLGFDLDPCSPGRNNCFTPAGMHYICDGLSRPWFGNVFMNPPFSGRNGHLPWLDKFVKHGQGIAIVNALTSSAWFQDWTPQMDAVLFPRGKTKFIRPDGSVGKSPGNGVAIYAIGAVNVAAIQNIDGLVYIHPNKGDRLWIKK